MVDHIAFLNSCYQRIQKAAASTGFQAYEYGVIDSYPLVAYKSLSRTEAENSGVSKGSSSTSSRPQNKSIYLSAGVHGDEPAPLLALIELWESRQFDDRFDWTICPIINPIGLARGTRENAAGIDLNRDYRTPQTEEVGSHLDWLSQHLPANGFDISICLHEDWEAKGPYLYLINKNADPTIGRSILAAMDTIIPVEKAPVIDEMAADNGLIQPERDIEQLRQERDDWPEAFYLWPHSQISITLESPSGFPMQQRVACQTTALKHIFSERS